MQSVVLTFLLIYFPLRIPKAPAYNVFFSLLFSSNVVSFYVHSYSNMRLLWYRIELIRHQTTNAMYLLCIRFGRKCFVCFICNARIFALSLLLLELEILRVLRLYGLSLVSDDDHISLFLSLSIEHHDCFRVYMCASQLLTSPVYNIIHKTHAFCIFHSFTRFALWPDERTWEFSKPYRLPIILPFCLYAVSGRFRCTHGLPFLPFLISSLNSATHFSPHVPNHQFSTCMFSTSQPNEYLLYFNIPNVYTLDTLRACHHTYMKGQKKNCVCALFWPAQIPPNPCEIMWCCCCCCWLRKRVKCKFLEPEPPSQVHWSESISILANAWYYTLRL